ncbi:MAG: ABC transporter ATP-binding protein [Candidatus Margulisiibacteriota bacterium]
MIVAQNVVKTYGRRQVLAGVSLQLNVPGLFGLVGKNGEGKTTLLQTVAGIVPCDSGQAHCEGGVGYAPEQPALYPDFTVEAFLKWVAAIKQAPLLEVEHQMASFLLTDVRHRYCGTLSKGYSQRVNLAQAFLGSPKNLLLDEPLSGLDPAQRVLLKTALAQVSGTTTVLISSHDIAELASLCKAWFYLDKGQLTALESPLGIDWKAS